MRNSSNYIYDGTSILYVIDYRLKVSVFPLFPKFVFVEIMIFFTH